MTNQIIVTVGPSRDGRRKAKVDNFCEAEVFVADAVPEGTVNAVVLVRRQANRAKAA